MFGDYIDRVLQYYEQKKAAKLLPQNLSKPTPAGLRNECLIVYKNNYLRKDEKTLRDFFGPLGEHSTYSRIIEHFDRDKFRPLVYFLKDHTIKTDDRNIELLAWLIGFDKRPYDDRIDYEKMTLPQEILCTEEDQPLITIPALSGDAEKQRGETGIIDDKTEHRIEPGNATKAEQILITTPEAGIIPKTRFTSRRITITSIIVIVAGIFFYWFTTGKTANRPLGSSFSNDTDCMYWADDHYAAIPCKQKADNAQVIALDTVMLRRFKKITRQDTITGNDIGRLWYARHNNQIEVFTVEGYHPVRTTQRLQRLSQRIYDRFILPLKSN